MLHQFLNDTSLGGHPNIGYKLFPFMIQEPTQIYRWYFSFTQHVLTLSRAVAILSYTTRIIIKHNEFLQNEFLQNESPFNIIIFYAYAFLSSLLNFMVTKHIFCIFVFRKLLLQCAPNVISCHEFH